MLRCTSEHRRSLSVPAAGRRGSAPRRGANLASALPPTLPPLQMHRHPLLLLPPGAMVPPPIESLLCSSTAPLSLPYWLQPPGCRSAVSKPQPPRPYPQVRSAGASTPGSHTTRVEEAKSDTYDTRQW
ncbi:hypothetical protein BIW11_12711 [Tropilaelaps mercedesae]|uniref:Uncharacterized protein n=1 Tax=Tropilaelaps mercedesae TaxID=418985 RepID=A0A1V9X568_9ACAR|nr:hypothetical protein BIW11_12711 [Tropilaelaps mercedesae]